MVNLYFNPRAPCGARLPVVAEGGHNLDFNPRAPCGARRFVVSVLLLLTVFQSARPVRGATISTQGGEVTVFISIRAPRAGRDNFQTHFRRSLPISIRAPRAGRDSLPSDTLTEKQRFQSARPVRGATAIRSGQSRPVEFQSSRPVRGATIKVANHRIADLISILAPRAGRDAGYARLWRRGGRFQSSRPVRGATSCPVRFIPPRRISILAPRAGRDSCSATAPRTSINFNPRAPCGARPRVPRAA